MIKVKFLGTNGWFDSNTGNTVSVLIECDNYYIILDAGNGISKLNGCIDFNKPVYLFLSHFHIDHIAGLHTLFMYKFTKGLHIIVQNGGTEILKKIISTPFTVPFEKLPFQTEIIEANQAAQLLPFEVSFLPLVHSTFNLGIRLEIDNKIISYCTDTSYCKNAVILSENADLLIAECSMRPNETTDAAIHLNPETAAAIAKNAAAKKLMLMHFDASRYTTVGARRDAELNARQTFSNSFASEDGLEIEV